MNHSFKFLIASSLVGSIVASCGPKQEQKAAQNDDVQPLTKQEATELYTTAKAIFGALPDKMPGSDKDTPELIALGKKLFFEKALSLNNSQSCNTCHNIENGAGGVDNEATSLGVHGKRGDRNSPTVLNAGFHFVQFWDGRAEDLKAQAKGPILNPGEMAMASEKDVEKRLSEHPEYPQLFKAAFANEAKPITYDNLAHAIAAFERTLVTPGRFDDYMKGDSTALTNREQRGLKTFVETGCVTCHVSPTLGGTMYQKLGLVHPYEYTSDQGRYQVTKKEEDKMMFKVPSLRNVALTAPYFHDGRVKSLGEAVNKMAHYQLGKTLTDEDTKNIVAFLGSLTDKNREAKKK